MVFIFPERPADQRKKKSNDSKFVIRLQKLPPKLH